MAEPRPVVPEDRVCPDCVKTPGWWELMPGERMAGSGSRWRECRTCLGTGDSTQPKNAPKQPKPPDAPKTQHTQPKGTDEHGKPVEPIEIPVPKREDVEDALDRLTRAKPDAD